MITYTALALQVRCTPVNEAASRDEARAIIHQGLETVARRVAGAKVLTGPSLTLVVLPEYHFTGFPLGTPIAEWADRAAVELDGPEHQRLAKIARDEAVYLCANCYELDENFPGIFFQSNVIFDPNGTRILRYRRLTSMYSPTPHDFLDKFLELYGWDGIFPVAKTPIGNLAAISSEEMQYPELVRAFALRGAEILCHPCSEPSSPQMMPKEIAKRARAIENMAYVVSANSGGIANMPPGDNACDGGSKVIDYRGKVMAEAAQGESANANAELNLTALRRYRETPNMNNFFPRLRMELFRQAYASDDFYPANTLMHTAPTPEHFRTVQKDVIQRLKDTGVITPEHDA